jgi:hypothetical protein
MNYTYKFVLQTTSIFNFAINETIVELYNNEEISSWDLVYFKHNNEDYIKNFLNLKTNYFESFKRTKAWLLQNHPELML